MEYSDDDELSAIGDTSDTATVAPDTPIGTARSGTDSARRAAVRHRANMRDRTKRWQAANLPLHPEDTGAGGDAAPAEELLRFVTPSGPSGDAEEKPADAAVDDGDKAPSTDAPPSYAEHQAVIYRVQALEQSLGAANRELRASVAKQGDLRAEIDALTAALEQRDAQLAQRDAQLKKMHERETAIAEREVELAERERAFGAQTKARPTQRPPSRDDAAFAKRRGLPPRRDSAEATRVVALPPLAGAAPPALPQQPRRAHSSLS